MSNSFTDMHFQSHFVLYFVRTADTVFGRFNDLLCTACTNYVITQHASTEFCFTDKSI